MIVDCDDCVARGPACDDCVVSVLLAGPAEEIEIAEPERTALAVLAGEGLVPPLRWRGSERAAG